MKKTILTTLVFVFVGVSLGYAKTMSVAKDQVNVRTQPSLNAQVLFEAPVAYPLEIKKDQGNWLYCEDWQGNQGWVYKPLVSKIPTTVVQAETANVRRGPGLNQPPIARVNKGEIYRVFGQQGEWVKIGYYFENETIGWIRQDLVWGY